MRARCNGIEIEYETFGERACEPVLLVMGLASQMLGWTEPFCEALAGRGYFVVRFDNRDVGLSTKLDGARHDSVLDAMRKAAAGLPVRAPYLLRDMAADTAGLIEALGLERAHVVGASMGGMIAQSLAIEFPERVGTLVSIMSTSGAPDLPGPRPEVLRLLLVAPPTSRAQAVAQALVTWRTIGSPGFPFDEARIRERAERSWDRCHHPAGVARQLVAISASGSRRRALGGVRAPTLVIHGEDDPLVPVACGRDTAQAIPGAQALFIPGMGHDLPVELYDTLVDAIARHAGAHPIRSAPARARPAAPRPSPA